MRIVHTVHRVNITHSKLQEMIQQHSTSSEAPSKHYRLKSIFFQATLTSVEIAGDCRLLRRVDGKTVVVLDGDPRADVCADIAGEGRNPFRDIFS